MQITRGYRTELDLNNQQITACKKHAGAARYAYNWGLKRKQEVYQATGRSISAMALHCELNQLKQTELPWMYEVSKAAPQEALRDLDQAMRNFFRRARLKECGYLPTSGVHILSVTVSEEAEGWYVSLQVQEEVPDPPPATGEPIGVDLGIKTLAQCSDGMAIENPKALRSELKRLRRLHRRLSRKARGSKNRTKARKKLARTYARIAHVRCDALHQATSHLTRARLSKEERTARNEEIASTLPEPKAKVKARTGHRPGCQCGAEPGSASYASRPTRSLPGVPREW